MDGQLAIHGRLRPRLKNDILRPVDGHITVRPLEALAEVPADWQSLRRANMTLALDWRTRTRRLFEHYLGQGYAITGYASGRMTGGRRNFYLLEKFST